MKEVLALRLKSSLLPGAIYFRDIRPLRVTARQASLALGASKQSRTLQRLMHAALKGTTKKDGTPWLVAQWGGQGKPTFIDTASLESAYQAMLEGEQPPLLPSELKRRTKYN